MNPKIKQYADILNGVPYGKEDTLIKPIAADLKEQNIVVVFGESDDLMELRGAIDDELGAWNGTTAYLNNKGLLSVPPCGYEESLEECPYYKAQERCAAKIKAVWCGGEGYSWTFETAIPHATFDVMEDGEKYCRGIVFCLDELALPLRMCDTCKWRETDNYKFYVYPCKECKHRSAEHYEPKVTK